MFTTICTLATVALLAVAYHLKDMAARKDRDLDRMYRAFHGE